MHTFLTFRKALLLSHWERMPRSWFLIMKTALLVTPFFGAVAITSKKGSDILVSTGSATLPADSILVATAEIRCRKRMNVDKGIARNKVGR